MGIQWKNRVKKMMAEALLGALLITPVAASAEVPQVGSFQTEAAQEQEGLFGRSLPGDSLAEGELPGNEDDDGAGIMPCGDLDDDYETIKRE